MKWLPWIPVFILGIIFIVITHELGHFFAAKAVGVKVEQFSIGFGPEIVGWDKGETRYSIKWFLAGGSVKILGMNPEEEIKEEDRGRSYYEVAYWKRAVVILAGSFVHLVLALILLYLIFWPIGYRVPTGRIDKVPKTIEVSKGKNVPSPAYGAGLQKGDLILEVNGKPVHQWADLQKQLSKRPGKDVYLKVKRDGTVFYVGARLIDVNNKGILGIEVDINDTFIERSNPISAVWQALKLAGSTTVLTVKAMGSLFSMKTLRMLTGAEPRINEGPLGPIGVVRYTYHAASLGVDVFLQVMAYILLFLALFNLVPLPPLDGSYLLIIIVEKITGKEIDMRKLYPVATFVVLIIVILFLWLFVLDIVSPFKFAP